MSTKLYRLFLADSVADLHGRPISGSTASERRKSGGAPPPIVTQEPPSAEGTSDEDEEEAAQEVSARSRSQSIQLTKSKFGSKGALHSPVGSAHSFDLQVC